MVVATKMFWALGYNQVEYVPDHVRSEARRRSIRRRRSRRPNGKRTPFTRDDMQRDPRARRAGMRTARTASSPAGCCPARSSAGSGTTGTRPDDPNDIVPHEHRRELRALRVFGAWTNLTDLKAGNTLDTLVTENGRASSNITCRTSARRSACATGSTNGISAGSTSTRATPPRSGCSRSGSRSARGRRSTYEEYPSIGRFEGDVASIRESGGRRRRRRPTWSCATTTRSGRRGGWWRSPTTLIRAAVHTGPVQRSQRPRRYLGDVLIKRRDKISQRLSDRGEPDRRSRSSMRAER